VKIDESASARFMMFASVLTSVAGTLEGGQAYISNIWSSAAKRTLMGPERKVRALVG
jgi:hypothetical protein